MKRNLKSISEFAKPYSPFSQASLRWKRFNAVNNGLAEAGAFVEIGRRVFVDEDRFTDWIDKQNAACRSQAAA